MKKLYSSLLVTSILLSFNIIKGAESELNITPEEAQVLMTGGFRGLVRQNPDKAIAMWKISGLNRGMFEICLKYSSDEELRPYGNPALGTDATKEVKSGKVSFKESNTYKGGDAVIIKRTVEKPGDPEYTWGVVLIKTTYSSSNPNAWLVQLNTKGDTKTINANEKNQTIGKME